MRMRTPLSASLYAATMIAIGGIAAGADDPALKGDLARLQGQWTGQFGPRKVPMAVTIKGTGVSLAITRPDGQERESKGEIRIDEDARPYKTIDWIKFTRPDGEPAPENLGIYKVDRDSITICNGGPGNERPTEFRAGAGGPPQLFVLSRKAAGGDRARLQGRWTAKVGPEKNFTIDLTIKGKDATLKFSGPDGQSGESKGEIRIDDNATPHKTLEWVNFTTRSGVTVPENLAIYKLDGDTLTICSGGIGNPRPTEFRAGQDNKPSLIVLKRE